jgi:cytochrome b5
MKIFLPIILVFLLLSGVYLYLQSKNSTLYTLSEISEHDSKDDCWLVIEGRVYDVTPFIKSAQHKGGEAILQGCGIDATELFNTRPMGSGTAHSNLARVVSKLFQIGRLAP